MADEKIMNEELDDEAMMDATGGSEYEQYIKAMQKRYEAERQAELNKLVTCPYCQGKVKNKDLQSHKDKCLLEQAKKAALAELQAELAKQN